MSIFDEDKLNNDDYDLGEYSLGLYGSEFGEYIDYGNLIK